MVALEITAALMGVVSVWLAKKENIWVFPTGIISTALYTWICATYELRGDMVINAYYTAMSLYGWYMWLRPAPGDQADHRLISRTNKREKIWIVISFVAAVLFVLGVYKFFGTPITYISYIDAFTTAVFFIAMWLMALKKIENWTFWILGNVISVPLYLIKHLCFTAVQYSIFLVIAIAGYLEWRRRLAALHR